MNLLDYFICLAGDFRTKARNLCLPERKIQLSVDSLQLTKWIDKWEIMHYK